MTIGSESSVSCSPGSSIAHQRVVDQLRAITIPLANYLKNWIQQQQKLGSRTFYGEAFSLAFLSQQRMLSDAERQQLIDLYFKHDFSDPQFHWEFNQYALRNYLKTSTEDRIKQHLAQARYKGTPCANWSLLRFNTQLLAGENATIILQDTHRVLKTSQVPSGLILDEPHVRSFQYHCFSLAMLAEIYEQTGDMACYRSFIKGVNFILPFILRDGNTLYVGRGQEQSFGYSSLIYCLATAYSWTSCATYLDKLEQVASYLKSFQKSDGSLPLVLNRVEAIDAQRPLDLMSPSYAGWYGYNNYFDYLPFTGFFLGKSINQLATTPQCLTKESPVYNAYQNGDYVVVKQENYDAVLAKPGGAWSNDLAMPYIRYKGKPITPCYGGEQGVHSLYHKIDLPLPLILSCNKLIRNMSFVSFSSNCLRIISPLGYMQRRFHFEASSIHTTSSVRTPFRFFHQFLFFSEVHQISPYSFDGPGYWITANRPLEYSREAYCALGPLKVYTSSSSKIEVNIHLK